MGQRTSSRQAGFTLLEVMAALAIVAALLVTLAYTTNYNLDLAGSHEAQTLATMLARDKLTEVANAEGRKLSTMKGAFEAPFDAFSFEVERSTKPVSLGAMFGQEIAVSMLKVTVTVTGRDERVSLKRYFPPETGQ